MTAQIQKWGNSLALRIPKLLAKEARVLEGEQVELKLTAAGILLEPSHRKRYTLAKLVAGIKSGNRHTEISMGQTEGRGGLVKYSGYVPDRGHAIWLHFNPQAGHEQAGRRPALVLSPKAYNARAGLVVVCPITSQVKGYPFEVLIPSRLPVQGVVLADQVRSLDWSARQAEFICELPIEVTKDVVAHLEPLIFEQT